MVARLPVEKTGFKKMKRRRRRKFQRIRIVPRPNSASRDGYAVNPAPADWEVLPSTEWMDWTTVDEWQL